MLKNSTFLFWIAVLILIGLLLYPVILTPVSNSTWIYPWEMVVSRSSNGMVINYHMAGFNKFYEVISPYQPYVVVLSSNTLENEYWEIVETRGWWITTMITLACSIVIISRLDKRYLNNDIAILSFLYIFTSIIVVPVLMVNTLPMFLFNVYAGTWLAWLINLFRLNT